MSISSKSTKHDCDAKTAFHAFKTFDIWDNWFDRPTTFFLHWIYHKDDRLWRKLRSNRSYSRSRVIFAPRWTLSIRLLSTGKLVRLGSEMRLDSIWWMVFDYSSVLSDGFEPNNSSLLSRNPVSKLFGKSSVATLRLTQLKKRLRISWTSEHPKVRTSP